MFKAPARIVHDILIKTGGSVAVAESLTSGHIQALLSARRGASEFFKGGVTAYTIPIKEKLLGVDGPAATRCDAVSPEVAGEMALGVCRLFDADFGIATTGYAEPFEQRAISEPYAHVAIASASGATLLFAGIFRGPGLGRKRMQMATAEFAVRALANVLTKQSKDDANSRRSVVHAGR